MIIGRELRWDPGLGRMVRAYAGAMGVPIVGLRVRWRWLQSILPAKASRILDAGCGRGVITRALALRYPSARLLGLDSEPNLQDRNTLLARKMQLSGCCFATGDLLDLEGDGCYDLIISVDNLEHVADDSRVLANLSRSLAPGGTLIVHVPHYYRRWPLWRWSVNFDIPGHVRPGYHLPELTERVRRAGLTVERCGFTYGFLENLANNLSYAITRGRESNRGLYALVFPLLNALAWLGHAGSPDMGAGVWVIARHRDNVADDDRGLQKG